MLVYVRFKKKIIIKNEKKILFKMTHTPHLNPNLSTFY
jgi:hypothetical protein